MIHPLAIKKEHKNKVKIQKVRKGRRRLKRQRQIKKIQMKNLINLSMKIKYNQQNILWLPMKIKIKK